MFKKNYLYELKYWLKTPSVYIYGLVFFSLAFLVFVGTAGLFDPPSKSDKLVRIVNSPYEINYVMNYFNKFFLFLLPAIIGASIYKDYQYRIHSILYTFPVEKSSYLLGRFSGSLSIVLGLTLSVGLAMMIGEQVPGLHENKLVPFNFIAYLQVYLVYVFPNMLIFGAIVFAVVAWTRNIYAGFITVIVLFLIQAIIENVLAGLDYPYLLGLLDPFGQYAVQYLTHLWTLEEQNTQLIPIAGIVIGNRLIWLGIAGLIFGSVYRSFTFSEKGKSLFPKKAKRARLVKKNFGRIAKVQLQKVEPDFSFTQNGRTLWKLATTDFKYILKSKLFLILAFFGLLAVVMILARVSNLNDMALLPATRIMLLFPTIFFTMVMILITFLYSGMLVHRPAIGRMQQLIDASPSPNWVLLLSKVLALVKIQAVLLLILMLSGIVIQVFNGYYHFEIGLYLFHLYALVWPVMIIWAFASVFVQTLFPNTYIGLFVLVLGWLGISGMPQLGIDSILILFNTPPEIFYSDLDAYGQKLDAYFLVESYWMVFGLILLIFALLFWNRGTFRTFNQRLRLAFRRLKGPLFYSFGILLVAFLFLGFNIFKGEQASQKEAFFIKNQKRLMAEFREKYQKYALLPQPRITKVNIKMNIYPKRHSFDANGEYVLFNKTENAIDTLLVKTGFDEITSFEFSLSTQIIASDAFTKYSILKLDQSLLPGDSMMMHFEVKNTENALFERNSNVLGNGTFLKDDLFPRIGYYYNTDKVYPNDSTDYDQHFYGLDADLVEYEAVVSTDSDQIAITPGYLQKEWVEGERRYFHYKMEQPLKYSFGFNSGRFEKKVEEWKGVKLEIYHHPAHTYNLEKMFNGLKSALDYNTQYFGSYQHQEARVIEFAQSEGTYATTSGNSIPTSEIRFLVNTDTATQKTDLSFYVPAHELTHQWWGAQLIPARTLGAVMLTESITEYISLNIYRRQYGDKQALNFLKQQRRRYLKGRTQEDGKEPPLVFAAFEQSYISYGKGTMAFNALSHFLGEDQLNNVLKTFLEDYKFKGAPYPSSMHLVRSLKQATPDSLQYLIEDFFETVTFYDNKIESVKGKKLPDQQYQLTVDLSMRKYRTGNEDNSETNLPLADYIELGVFDEAGKLLVLQKYKITDQQTSIDLQVNQKPFRVELDPQVLTIDLDRKTDSVEVVW